jgi:putative ABC transport system permease protein
MLEMKSGQWIRLPNEVVLGENLATSKGIQVGDSVTLGKKRMRVSGIGRVNGVGYAGSGNAYVNLDTLREMGSLGDLVSVIMVDTDRPADTASFIRDLRPLDTYTTDAVLKQVLDVANGKTVFYYGISALALGISALFVGNVLSNNVAERRLEIATLRAIGISTPTVLGMILFESLVISLLAYVIGVLFSTALGELTNIFVAPIARVDKIFVPDPVLYLQIFGVAIVLGVVAGFFPARSALRVQPADALREA